MSFLFQSSTFIFDVLISIIKVNEILNDNALYDEFFAKFGSDLGDEYISKREDQALWIKDNLSVFQDNKVKVVQSKCDDFINVDTPDETLMVS